MANIPYKDLRILVADDFSNFRSTVNRMLLDLGVENVDMASNADEIIEQCSMRSYDVVLCDYNLGSGRNGQHVLEELRFKSLLTRRSVFILVSAESSRNIVMSAYDSAPDDYLMKPITTKMLYNRLGRLLQQRAALEPVYRALDKGDQHTAMDVLVDLSIAEDRNSTVAQKLLGEMFLANNQYNKAEKLYMRVLEVRELDWARLGLAKAKHLQGHYDQAGKWLEKIIEENYLYLPAYDVLSDNCLNMGNESEAQKVVQRSVDVSPMSILRQKNLAKLANENGDREVAVDALRKVVKLGKLSCYGRAEDRVMFARAVAAALEEGIKLPIAVVNESTEVFDSGATEEADFVVHGVQLKYISARLSAARGEVDKAKNLLVEAETSLQVEDSDIDIEIDHCRALIALDYPQKMKDLLKRLQEIYADDQQALEKLDEFLDEPASDANKALVAEVNRDGIDLYNEGSFDKALSCFDKATKLFPKHIGLQLNIIQALIGKLRANPSDQDTHQECRKLLESVSGDIDSDNSQYKRFVQLKNMARSFSETA